MATLARSASAGFRGRSLSSRFWSALRLQRTRARLGQLPAHLLDDIGVTRGQARREASTRAWDVPGWWRD